MTPERWQRIDGLVDAALELEFPRRTAFLNEACAGDAELLLEVESLLAAHQRAATFIERPAARPVTEFFEESQPEQLEGKVLGPYKVVCQIGSGGMGRIYLARDSRLGRSVALKLLREDLTRDNVRVRRFKQEARAASALNHPNILTIHDIGEVDGTYYIATEFVEGEPLRSLMKSGTLELAEALDIAIQVANALGAAHNAGIVHRDIKPENIMLRSDGYVKVLDFGIAKLIEHDQVGASSTSSTLVQTSPGVAIGTPQYMSPEQARGVAVDKRTDIFSLGIVLYEMIAGRAPFVGVTASDVMVSIVAEEPQALTECCPAASPEFARIVSKALRKAREDRYQTASDLASDLRVLREELKAELKLERSSPAAFRTADEPSALRNSRAVGGAITPAKRGRRLHVMAAVAVVAIAGAIVASMKTNAERPLTLAEFSDDFDIFNPNRWNVPAKGWAVGSDGRLHIEDAPAIGFAKNINYRDVVMRFHLKLTNAGGAAWAVHVKDSDNYYLFYISGPEGLAPGRFNTYIIRNGKFDPKDFVQSTPIIARLRAGGEYELEVTVTGNAIENKIIPADTGQEIRLDYFTDTDNLFPNGTVGFRSVGLEQFSIDELYVLPPEGQSSR